MTPWTQSRTRRRRSGRYIFVPGRPGPTQYVGNQSVRGAIARITHNSAMPIWLLAATTIGLAGLLTARRRTVPVALLTAVFVMGLPWRMPFAGDREYDWTLIQSVAGDAYLLGGLLLLYVLNSEARIR